MYTRIPARPVVAMPMASAFNEKVCMDLKRWKNKWILHMIDMFTRFTVSVFIGSKQASEVVDKILKCWISIFGVMGAILTDNGGEFIADETREVASILNIELCTTGAESPFQNGLCERNHSIIDTMLMKLQEENRQTSSDVLLCWANTAKNALQMWHGFSSYQLVFGQNPRLPNVMSENLPALSGVTSSEVLSVHLNALHAARRAFVQSEAEERVRRALRSKIRASETFFQPGDRDYYKREGQEKWLRPGKVVFQDGKVIFVRHGSVFVRVSANRLVPAVKQFAAVDDDIGEMMATSSRTEQPATDHEKNRAKVTVDEDIDQSDQTNKESEITQEDDVPIEIEQRADENKCDTHLKKRTLSSLKSVRRMNGSMPPY